MAPGKRVVTLLVLASLALLAPTAGAIDPFSPLVCDVVLDGCTTVGVCVQDVYCQRHLCDPALDCRGEAGPRTTCAVNETIEGRTCHTGVGASADAGRRTLVPPGMHLDDNHVGAHVTFTEGDARLRALPNVWFSHEARLEARAAGVTLADTRVHAYRSVLLLDPQEGAQSVLFPESNHTLSQVGLHVRHDSNLTGSHDVVIGIVTLDSVPEGCFVRSSRGVVSDYRCPALPTLV